VPSHVGSRAVSVLYYAGDACFEGAAQEEGTFPRDFEHQHSLGINVRNPTRSLALVGLVTFKNESSPRAVNHTPPRPQGHE
jgi:hypothetical protein